MDYKIILEAVWLFIPISAANQMPGLTNKFNLPFNFPVSIRWLGENKTWAAYYSGALGAMVVITIQSWFTGLNQAVGLFNYQREDNWLIGVFMGLGAILGDHVKSFFKRCLSIKPGEPWQPFDAIDYVVGGVVLSALLIGWPGWSRFIAMIAIALIIHLPGNLMGKRLGLRKTVW